MDWLTTYTHHSELQVITALSLISTLYKSLHTKSSLAYSVSNNRFLATTSNSGYFFSFSRPDPIVTAASV
jgi:predicted Zn-dependent peptidase